MHKRSSGSFRKSLPDRFRPNINIPRVNPILRDEEILESLTLLMGYSLKKTGYQKSGSRHLTALWPDVDNPHETIRERDHCSSALRNLVFRAHFIFISRIDCSRVEFLRHQLKNCYNYFFISYFSTKRPQDS